MQKLSFKTPEGNYNIKKLKDKLSGYINILSSVFPETKSLKPIISKLTDIMREDKLEIEYKSIKSLIKSFKEDARECSKVLILEPLQFEMDKIKETQYQKIKDLVSELKDIRNQIESKQIKRENIMLESLGKGTRPSQIKPRTQVFSSISVKLRKLARFLVQPSC